MVIFHIDTVTTAYLKNMDFIAFLLALIQSTYAGYCSYRRYNYTYFTYYAGYIYCYNDCCGYYTYRYCCYRMPGGTIAGAVIGALVVIGVIVGIIVFICIKKKRGARGRVIAPQPNTGGVSVIHTSHTHTMPVQQINYGYQPQPPGYQQPMTGYSQPPAAYPPPPPPTQYYTGPTGGTDPAYPPPPTYPAGASAPQFGLGTGPPPGYPQKS